ncbi:SDR family oxidoreductase [Halalkalicoccus jeotgali]|uniref:Short-chain dehydrogenase/reductase SDR n=1 Tax=Halalkalicoccus jeotgali (strain DSM 18796 / CECT 7217 / JCM 14584 / KCTC 4019 / B3) TaxID=795797 RepID=D8J8M8_HALJB|nr:SDR family oxidoreductase [Halalkalicoccus jeotgali]ADJ14213.1 short-chain dehydrogenase/reductase SDR [Halalkalicoccus jeotgali B3]ELY34605.1 short-chain dehydrogenase/reductase SDR [Halalkalicoccus jeotgali B3]
MSTDEFDPTVPELTADDLLVLDDPRFGPGTVAVVTGAASGIGRATAVALAANGLTVVGADIDEDGLEETVGIAADVGAAGEVRPVRTDLTADDEVESMVEAAAEAGDLRYVANIAGMQHIASIPAFPMDRYDLLSDLMVRAPFLVSKLAMPHIRDTDDGVGAIGNMSSVHGHYATKDKPAYITAKHALNGLTRSIAAEGEGTLRGFSVSVGYVLTPLMADQIADTATERGISEREVVEDVMLGQARTTEMMAPAEVANLFVFGFSSHATHLNGGDLLFDGGFTTTYE